MFTCDGISLSTFYRKEVFALTAKNIVLVVKYSKCAVTVQIGQSRWYPKDQSSMPITSEPYESNSQELRSNKQNRNIGLHQCWKVGCSLIYIVQGAGKERSFSQHTSLKSSSLSKAEINFPQSKFKSSFAYGLVPHSKELQRPIEGKQAEFA